jgi:hypothetical protein
MLVTAARPNQDLEPLSRTDHGDTFRTLTINFCLASKEGSR